MNRSSWSFIALLVSLVCFVVALLLTASVVPGANFRPWVDGGFVCLVFALLIERNP